MIKILVHFIIAIVFYACSNTKEHGEEGNQASNIKKSENLVLDKEISNFIYKDSEESSFILTKQDELKGYEYETIEIDYKLTQISHSGSYFDTKLYFAKYKTITKSCSACDGQERKIKAELHPFENPQKIEFTIEKDCDELILYHDKYKTIKDGCCGGQKELAIYDYQNKLIIEGDDQIILGEIPRSKVKIFVAWKNSIRDTSVLGTLFFCYSSGDKYEIKIKGNNIPEFCTPISPNIIIDTDNSDDNFDKIKNEYTLWSLSQLDNNGKINNLMLKFSIDCDDAIKYGTIVIPIINGKPFGKEDRTQFISLRPK